MSSNDSRKALRTIRGRFIGATAVVVCLASFLTAPAQAAFHLMTIQEVFVGPPGDGVARPVPLTPDQRAQYVMLRMTSGGQTLVLGASIRVEDANGNVLGTFGTFTANVANAGGICSYPGCPAIVIGTQAAANLFSFPFDKIVDGQAGRVALPSSGGRACFVSGASAVDCVAWGNFNCNNSGNCLGANTLRSSDSNANLCDNNFDAPAPAPPFGFVLGHGATWNCAVRNNAADFTLKFPHPANNAGANSNSDADGDGLVDRLDCNDASVSFLWPAVEVQNERVTGSSPSTISWDSQVTTAGTAATYDVVRGTLSALNGFLDATCFAQNVAAISTTDALTPFPAGTGLYYLERAGTGPGCVGTYGTGFNPATSRDPVLGAKCP